MMRSVRIGILLLLALVFAPVAARAAGAQMFVPTSSWLVGPASPVPAGDTTKMPCVMINQYDNGFTFRFSGGGGRILAMAVDFHQRAFKPGQSYRVDIQMGPYMDVALPGTAYNEATLIINTQQVEGFYNNLASAQTIRIGVGNARMEFALLGVTDGLGRVEGCYEGGVQVKAAPQPAPPVGGGTYHVSAPEEVEKLPLLPDVITPLPDEAMPEAALPAAHAEEGNTTAAAVEAMLHQAARMAGNPEPASGTQAQAPEPAPAPAEKKEKAIYEEHMLARNWASPFTAAQTRAQEKKMLVNAAAKSGQPGREWNAAAGGSLRAALTGWAEAEGADIIWRAGQDYPLPQEVAVTGGFEQAVADALALYEETDPRPVGRIYKGANGGGKVLVVDTHKGE